MSTHTRLACLLLAAAALVLGASAVGYAAEGSGEGTTTSAGTTQASTPETTSSIAVTETPSPPSSTATTQASTAPAAPARAPRSVPAPKVRAQRPQRSTPGSRASTGKRQGAAANGGRTGAGAPARGPRAPSPSALTPPLPLAFSSSLSGIPTFFIESFRIPPFLLPIFQAAGTAYGVPWQVLAAINEVETDYGRDLSVSSAGAEGWMQFLPSSWAIYGVDANGDGFKDPYHPADAIFAAARYLRAAGAATDLPGAIFAYNHSRAYVESVLLRARLLGGTPSELLGAITGLTQARFPVHAPSHFSDGFPPAPPGSGGSRTIPGTTIYSEAGAPVIAVQDGRIVAMGRSRELGSFISLRDAYGNTYTYADLGRIATYYPVLRPHEGTVRPAGERAHGGEPAEPRPTTPASAGAQLRAPAPAGEAPGSAGLAGLSSGTSAPGEAQPGSASAPAGAAQGSGLGAPGAAAQAPAQAAGASAPAPAGSTATVFRAGPNDVYLHRMHAGAEVIAGTILGHVGAGGGASGGEASAHVLFQIRPAGEGAPLIDPKPILDGWVQMENTSIYGARGANPYLATAPTPGQVLLESKQQLAQQVLANTDIHIYRCGRQDVAGGQIDRRVLATIEFLAVSGLRPSVSSLQCPGSQAGAESSSAHRSGEAVDIAAVNGVPLAGHQGAGSLADQTVRKLLQMQGPMRPRQIVSLMRYPGAANTRARGDHYDRIEVSFYSAALGLSARSANVLTAAVSPAEWIRLIARLGEIPNPAVRSGHSAAAIPVRAASGAGGEGEGNGNG